MAVGWTPPNIGRVAPSAAKNTSPCGPGGPGSPAARAMPRPMPRWKPILLIPSDAGCGGAGREHAAEYQRMDDACTQGARRNDVHNSSVGIEQRQVASHRHGDSAPRAVIHDG